MSGRKASGLDPFGRLLLLSEDEFVGADHKQLGRRTRDQPVADDLGFQFEPLLLPRQTSPM